jgi:hypothetical protein
MQWQVVSVTRHRDVDVMLTIVLVGVLLSAGWLSASASGGHWTCKATRKIWDLSGAVHVVCVRRVWVSDGTAGTSDKPANKPPVWHQKPHVPTYAERVAKIKEKNKQAIDAYKAALAQRSDHYRTGECVFTAGGPFTGQNCAMPNKPDLINIPDPPEGSHRPTQPTLPPEEAAYLAIATKLRISASGVGIGPNPDTSRWKMAVVGHSYWLWATGPTHLGPVSDSASGRTVTLTAALTKVTFDMGDGHTVTCHGAGIPYPGDKKGLHTKSPTCGHTYQQTSTHHPGGTYPVRATTYWNVAYTAPDGSGNIPIVLSSQRHLKVGELQTVITH